LHLSCGHDNLQLLCRKVQQKHDMSHGFPHKLQPQSQYFDILRRLPS
jgi:hypothetical protein